MSQKPKPGSQARAALVPKVARAEAELKPAAARPATGTEPAANAGPIAETEPVAIAEQATEAEPVATGPSVEFEGEPAMTVTPMSEDLPIAEAEPMVTAAPETKVSMPESVDKTFAAASASSAAATNAVIETIEARRADSFAAIAAEAVEAAPSITPTPTTITQGIKTMMKSTEDFVAFGQANLEAFVKSGQIWSAGVQELTKLFATSAKASFDESVSTFKAISTAKSVKEAMELQSSFAKAALEKAMAESNKLTDASIKLTEQTLAPITARVTVAVESFGKAA